MRVRSPALLAILAGVGCAGQPIAPPKAKEIAPPVEALAPPFVSPARWEYHPAAPDGALAAVTIEGGGCVLTAEGGQRWTSAAADSKSSATRSSTRCTGKAQASSFLAAEDLVSVIHRADKGWLFIGAGGTLFESADPLGAFTRTVAPPEPLARVAGAGAAVLAATWEGKLLRWEEATGWRAVTSAPPGRIFDLAVGEDQRALALAFPEALFVSEDGGVTWSPGGAPLVGARSLGLSASGELGADGVVEAVTWTPGKTPAFARSKQALPHRGTALDLDVGRTAASSAVTAGRAFIDGDRYLEVVRPENEGEEWLLARGGLEGRLVTALLPDSTGCGSIRLGGRGRTVYQACVSLSGSEMVAVIRQSADGGDTWSASLPLGALDTDQISITVSPDGGALITGVCKAESDTGCHPTAPFLVRTGEPSGAPPDGGATKTAGPRLLKAMVTGAPQLSGQALLPSFSFDGRSAYFLGRRTKDDKMTLFVSHDGGETFSQRALEIPGNKPVKRARDYDEEEGSDEPADDFIEVDESSSIHAGEDGSVGLLVTRSRGLSYLLADEDGRVLHETAPPSDEATMGGFGRHLVAYGFNESRDANVALWESSDGGASWEEGLAPGSLGHELSRGNAAIACGSGGCLLGDAIARVGWGGVADAGPVERTSSPDPTSTPAVLTPIVCDLSPATHWTRLPNVAGWAPGMNAILRGRSQWSLMTSDPATGAVNAVSATLPESGEGEARVTSRPMLARRPSGKTAQTISWQMEGFAAARVPVPAGKDGEVKPGAPMHNVELAWENYMEGTSGHARIADAGVFEEHDTFTTGSGDLGLDAGLVTVSVRGMFLRPHSSKSKAKEVFFADLAGKTERLLLPEWPKEGLAGPLDLRGDVIIADGQPLGVALVRDASSDIVSVMLGHRVPGDRWETGAIALAPTRTAESPLMTHVDWTYGSRTSIGLTSLTADRHRPRGWAFFQPFLPDGSFGRSTPLPTLLDLGDRPRPCSAADRAASPRFESTLFSRGEVLFQGMRHPVLVSEPPVKNAAGVAEPIVLLTAGAIAYGTPSSPCVAGWEADGLSRSQDAAVISGDLAHSWVFRSSPGGEPDAHPGRPARRPDPSASAPALEYRPMACHFDPSARIPEAVWNEKGTARIER